MDNIKQKITVQSPNVRYIDGFIESDYEYDQVQCRRGDSGELFAFPMKSKITFRTSTKVPRFGLMLVGWGGNNGSTVTAAILANSQKLSWRNKEGVVRANYFGSLTQSATVLLGKDEEGKDVYVPMKDLLPMVQPNDIILDGWDISSANLGESMRRAQVLDIALQDQLYDQMKEMKPRPSVFDADFVAANQAERADNLVKETRKSDQVERIRADIRDFREKQNLDNVIVLWTANTERYVNVSEELHGTAENLLSAIDRNESEISPSILYAVASILEGATYLNGSPQNTFVPGLQQLADNRGVFIGGDDFKSGQTKFKSVLVDFLVGAGIKPCSIVSYNHLGNNDGYNLSAPQTFRSKEISKSNVVDDMVASNQILYGQGKLKPDHCVVIKYIPHVGDSKRAMDEYTSELMLGGRNTIVVHNTCEDSLLASPIILDLAILAELFQRVQIKVHGTEQSQYQKFHSVLSLLAYLLKAPLVEPGAPVVNALFKQRMCIENVMRALISLPPVHHMDLEYKLSDRSQWASSQSTKILSGSSSAKVMSARCSDCNTGLKKQTATSFA